MVSGGMSLVKYLLFLFNFIFWLSGIALLIVGTVLQVKFRQYVNVLGDDFLATPIIFIAAGCVIGVLGFFGCCGAIRENYCMTMTFAVLLGVIFIVECAVGIAGYVLHNDLETIVSEQMQSGMRNYNQTSYEGLSIAWDEIQIRFHCCGVANYTDWSRADKYMANNDLPDSCCRRVTRSCGEHQRDGQSVRVAFADDADTSSVFTQGCVGQMQAWVKDNVTLVGCFGAGICAVQLMVMLVSCCFSKQLSDTYAPY